MYNKSKVRRIKMKKVTNKVVALFLTLCLIIGITSAGALETDTQLYVTDELCVDSRSIEPLYNSDDNIIAYYLHGNNNYAIISTDGALIEYSENSMIREFNKSKNSKLYYSGVGNYFVETSTDKYVRDVFENRNISKKEIGDIKNLSQIKSFDNAKIQDVKITNSKKSVTITYPDGVKDPNGNNKYTDTTYTTLTLKSKANLPNSSRYFSYNYNGTCGSTTSAILMYYYYDNINKSYIKNKKYQGRNDNNQKKFVKHFQTLLNDNGKGTSYSKVKSGLNKYLGEVSKSKSCDYVTKSNVLYSVSSKIMNCIDDKKPCIVGLSNEPTYKNHWTVGLGYAKYYGVKGHTRGNVYFIKVNNGWYNSSKKSVVYVNYKYVDGLIYLK